MPETVPVAVKVNGVVHEGFTQGSVEMSLGNLPSRFSVSYDDLASQSDDPRAIYAGDRVTVEVDGEGLIVGVVDDSEVKYSDDRMTFSVSGRSITCDLVDCAAEQPPEASAAAAHNRAIRNEYQAAYSSLEAAIAVGNAAEARRLAGQIEEIAKKPRKSGAWTNIKLDAIASKLLEPFGIDFIITGDVGDPFRRFKIDQGETPADALARAARMRGRILYDVNGSVVIERAGEADTSTVLQRGVNVLAGSHTSSWSDRFSIYIFRGQTQATDDLNGASAHHIRGHAVDPQITRYRPFLVTHSTGQGGTKDLGKRAILERNQRMGRGERVTYTVDGWKTDEGWLWRPNVRVFVEDDWLGIQGELLVVAVSYQFGVDEPPQTRLELTRPEAYDEIDFPARGRGRLWI